MAYTGFKALEAQLAQRGGVHDPAALAATIGRRKYGEPAMHQAAATGRSLKGHKPKKKRSARDEKIAMFAHAATRKHQP